MPGSLVTDLGRRARAASRVLATTTPEQKNAALLGAADLLEERAEEILHANAGDLATGERSGMDAAPLDRLRLDADRISSMAGGLRQVADLPDPVGEELETWTRPNGLRVRKIRVPLGVIAIIYENRPNVTSDAAGLCLKSGNATILRGSSTAIRSNIAIAGVLREAIGKEGLPEDAVILVEDTAHDTAIEVMQLTGFVDCLIPRGGPALIRSILENARVPYVIDGDGNCHVYVDAAADLDLALTIVVNAKTQRPSVCNAAESLVVHADVASTFLPRVCEELAARGVELVGDAAARGHWPAMGDASEDDFAREFLDLRMSVAVAPDLESAIDHVNRFSTGHTEAILTEDHAAAERFASAVDSGTIIVNASTRFTDGEQFGFGAEIGISTQKLHARGPMALRELTTYKYVVVGNGQIRE